MLNLRPDCDCVPRGGMEADAVELYCVEGKRMSDSDLRKQYQGGTLCGARLGERRLLQ